MRFLVFKRPLLLLPAVLAAIALPASPALAGEGDDDDGTAKLRASQGCVSGDRAKATVTGDNIDEVAFYVDGELVKRVTRPDDSDRYVVSMRCARLSVGAHRARAVVTFEEGSSPALRTLRFQITRSRQASPRFTG
jgi:hypothetical protein